MTKRIATTTATSTDPSVLFYAELDEILAKAVIKHERLLFHKDGWSIDDGCKQEIMDAVNNLEQRFIYRASLFAMHRSGAKNVEALKKLKIAPQEDDLEMAWKTLDM
jgi:hypothetical protein